MPRKISDAPGVPVERITATVPQFCVISGMGKTKVFSLLKNGTLQSIKIGQSRLVVLESYWRIIEEQAALVRINARANDGKADGTSL